MRRTRQKDGNKVYYLFTNSLKVTGNMIENDINYAGTSFKATKQGEKLKETVDQLSGRVVQTTTIVTIKTQAQLDFKAGHLVSTIARPNENQMSTIVRVKSSLKNTRGGKRNTEDIRDWVIELS